MPASPETPLVFGVRHLSPGAARHLLDWLDEHRPAAVLVEGPADFTPLIPELLAPGVVPPVALLAWTTDLPVRTVVHPFARYSPEYQALRWAAENGAEARFVDLPSGCMVALEGATSDAEPAGNADGAPGAATEEDAGPEGAPTPPPEAPPTPRRVDAYAALAEAAGLPDYETYWEQRFEHDRTPDGYRRAARALGDGLREVEGEHAGFDLAENLAREAHMRRETARCAAELDVSPERIALVVGAFHASAVERAEEPLTDDQLAALPHRPTDLTLMPYTYFRLSSRSGYGAGNRAPAYYELMWEHLEGDGDLGALPADYLSRVVRERRAAGHPGSTAEVIEAVRLARALAAFRGVAQPTLADLHDAATTLFGHGRLDAVAEALARTDVGDRTGRLPAGARQSSIQADFAHELARLKLERFRTPVRETLALDLRENRRVESEAAAFRDLHRSFFLHRLATLGIGFGRLEHAPRDAEWVERWSLQWEPEREVELVEAVLLGDTVTAAVGVRFAERLGACTTIDAAGELVRVACTCGLPEMLDRARLHLQAMAADATDFTAVGTTVGRLGATLRYGDVRRLDLGPLRPLLADLYRQGAIRLEGACSVDADAARRVAGAMAEIHATGDEHHELLDEGPWLAALRRIALRDDPNPYLSGFAAALLLERDALDEDALVDQLSLRFSPGAPADLAAGWFEGLATRNRAGLLSRPGVWAELARWVKALPDEAFPRALVCLRRAIGQFSPAEKRHVADHLGALWGRAGPALSGALETPLTASEQDALDELGDMDFGDL